MKKFISIILSLVLVLSLAAVASAATITITAPTADGTVSGETYTAYKVFSGSFSGENDVNKVYTITTSDKFYSAVSTSALFTLTAVPGSTTEFYVTAAEGATAPAIAALLNGVTDKGTGLESTYANGTYTIADADEGYYLIVSSFGSGLIVDTVGHSNITVEPKNTYPSMTKKIVSGNELVDTITADRGATITFKITVNIPSTVNGNIIVHDTLDEDMTFGALTATTGVSVLSDCTDTDCAGNVHFEIDYATVVKDADNNVSFTYTATLNGDAETATEHTNTAWLTYSAFTSTEDTVSVYTYEVDVYKYTMNGENKAGLAGAGFVLKNADGKYYKNTDGIVSWVDTEAAADEYTTAATTYTITFAGLANGTYTLVEKTVPAGYNKANDVTVTINGANLTGPIDEQGSQIEVLNSTGSELPSTGGIGTTIFYVVGCLLMTGAVVLLVTKRRMGNA